MLNRIWHALFGKKDIENQPLIEVIEDFHQDTCKLESFPIEILEHIFTKLSNEDIANVACTSKKLNAAAEFTRTYADIDIKTTTEAGEEIMKVSYNDTYSQIRQLLTQRSVKQARVEKLETKVNSICGKIPGALLAGGLGGFLVGTPISLLIAQDTNNDDLSTFSPIPLSIVLGWGLGLYRTYRTRKHQEELLQLQDELNQVPGPSV